MIVIKLGIKRCFDIITSSILILVLTAIPVFVVVPIIICATSKGASIFKQERVGRHGKHFQIFKFRTMLLPEERVLSDGSVLEPNESITKIGGFLRKTSLDELPQLFNIFLGHMSIVGPRPMIPSQVEKITAGQHKRHKMRPGVTGLAQVNGRNNLTWDEKLYYDVKYVNEFSLWLDICILVKTIRVIIKREGIDYIHTFDK